jgi:protein O-mannosyl-transferase
VTRDGGTSTAKNTIFTRFVRSDSAVRTLALALVLVGPTIVIYWQVHTHPFFNLDDYLYVVNNPHIQAGLGWKTVYWAFTCFTMANWIPLSYLSHSLDFQLFGLDPAGHHLVNILLHALNVLLLFVVLKRATGYTGRSLMVAALFALHPMNVEPVVWIAERKTMLSMVFFLLALEAYRRYAVDSDPAKFRVVTIFFALGLMAKPQIITLPFVLLLWDYWPLGRIHSPGARDSATTPILQEILPLVKEKASLWILCGMAAMIALATQKYARLQYQPPLWLRLENAVYSYVRYLGKTFWPSAMAPEYPHPGSSLSLWVVLGSLLVLLAVTAFAAKAHGKPYLLVGWLWFLGTLVPMIGIVQVGTQGMADRYAYQSFIGLFIMVCWGVAEWAEQRHLTTAWLVGSGTIILVALSVVTYRQIGYWKDNPTIWTHALEVIPGDWAAEDNVGNEMIAQGKTSEAMVHFFRASAMNPNDAVSNLRVGFYEQLHGNPEEAILHYQRALRDVQLENGDRAGIYRNLGSAYRAIGDLNNANQCFEKAASFKTQ